MPFKMTPQAREAFVEYWLKHWTEMHLVLLSGPGAGIETTPRIAAKAVLLPAGRDDIAISLDRSIELGPASLESDRLGFFREAEGGSWDCTVNVQIVPEGGFLALSHDPTRVR